MRWFVAGLFVLLEASPAKAQLSSGEMAFPARAGALRPTGMTQLRFGWMTRQAPTPAMDDTFTDADFLYQELEARVPLGSVVLEAAAGVSQEMGWNNASGDNAALVHAQNPELGAYFCDAPDVAWRYELGGSLAFPLEATAVIDPGLASDGGGGGFLYPGFRTGPGGEERAGWLARRHVDGAVVGTARAYLELSPVPELVLAALLEVPMFVGLDGGFDVYPAGSVTVAYRDEELLFVGLETRVSSFSRPAFGAWEPSHNLGVALVPFARMGFLERDEGGFVRIAGVLPLGFSYPLVGLETSFFGGYLGGEVSLGALY